MTNIGWIPLTLVEQKIRTRFSSCSVQVQKWLVQLCIPRPAHEQVSKFDSIRGSELTAEGV